MAQNAGSDDIWEVTETIWNPRREPAEVLDLALSPYYRRER